MSIILKYTVYYAGTFLSNLLKPLNIFMVNLKNGQPVRNYYMQENWGEFSELQAICQMFLPNFIISCESPRVASSCHHIT